MEKRLKTIATKVRAELDRIDQAREEVLPVCRDIVRMASETIKQVHRQQWPQADKGLTRMKSALKDLGEKLKNHPELRFAGFVTTAEQEYAEAHIIYSVLLGKRLPGSADLGISCAGYLNGMADAIGEMRRQVLEQIRNKRFREAESLLETMDIFYFFLFSLDYPDAIVRGLRRQVDADRSILERTRSDFTLALVQEDLRQELYRYHQETEKKKA